MRTICTQYVVFFIPNDALCAYDRRQDKMQVFTEKNILKDYVCVSLKHIMVVCIKRRSCHVTESTGKRWYRHGACVSFADATSAE